MKSILFICLSSLLAVFNSFSQAPNWQWAHESGSGSTERGQGICHDPSNNDIVTIGFFESAQIGFSGTTLTNAMTNFTSDILLVRYNSSGTLLWAKSFGGSGHDQGNAVVIDGNGDIIITGYFESPTISFGSVVLTSSGETDCFIVKLDANGNVIWARHSTGLEDEYGIDVAVDNAGNIAVVGYFRGANFSFGSFGGSIIGLNSEDVFTVKYNSSGTSLWVNVIGGTKDENAHEVIFDAAGDVIISGGFNSVNLTVGTSVLVNFQVNTYDAYIIKYAAAGAVTWVKGFGGYYSENALGLTTDAANNILLTGYFESATLQLGPSTLTNSTLDDWYDMVLAKLDPAGNFLWATSAGGQRDEYGQKIGTDAQGNIYVAGYFDSDTVSFGSTSIINNGSFDVYVGAYNSSGTFLWTQSAGGGSVERIHDMTVTSTGVVAVTGYFNSNTLHFGSVILDNSGDNDLFAAQLDEITGISDPELNELGVSVYFSNGSLEINSEKIIDKVNITNMLGQLIENSRPSSEVYSTVIKIPGIYVVSVTMGKNLSKTKVVVNQF